MASIHDGHRARLKNRFADFGLESFSDFEALELLLFYALPRRDTNELAHALIKHFGSYRAVMEAEISDLKQVPGLGENAAGLIRLTAELGRRYAISERKTGTVLDSAPAAGEYLTPLFSYRTRETIFVLSLDNKSTVTHCRELAEGTVNRVDFAVRDIVDIALRDKATSIIIAHNHLSGTALPSASDIETTRKLKNALGLIGVTLRDHIIICEGDYVSLLDSEFFKGI